MNTAMSHPENQKTILDLQSDLNDRTNDKADVGRDFVKHLLMKQRFVSLMLLTVFLFLWQI